MTINHFSLEESCDQVLQVANVLSTQDYYPFGMVMPGRAFQGSDGYRYGFNGKEMDNEVAGDGNQYDYGFRIYNPRLGKFLSVDPLTKSYPELTPYQYASNTPIWAIDLDGLEAWPVTRKWQPEDFEAYADFVQKEIATIIEKTEAGEVSTGTVFDCADLAVYFAIRYAAENGLEIKFTSTFQDNRNGRSISKGQDLSSSDEDLIKYNSDDPEASIQEYIDLIRGHTHARSLMIDFVQIDREESQIGDFIISGGHVDVLRDFDSNESYARAQGLTPTISGTTGNSHTVGAGVLVGEDRKRRSVFTDTYNSSFYRIRQLNNPSIQVERKTVNFGESKLKSGKLRPVLGT